MALKCTSCGGTVVYNIDKRNLCCEYCGQKAELAAYSANNAAETETSADGGMALSVFRCQSCGAELCAPDEQTVAYCSYCGNESLLLQKEKAEFVPKQIIPFAISKKKVMEKYKDALEKKLFLPKEMTDPTFMEGFRGIYIPYISTKLKVEEENIVIHSKKTYTKGGYDYSEIYDVEATIGGVMDGGTHDASAAFDDTIAAEIAPYKASGLRDFHQGYLAGFYADRITSEVNLYREFAIKGAPDAIEERLTKKSGDAKPMSSDWKKKMRVSVADETVSLFPIWFLTWRKKNRVAYSVMNGQTGETMLDTPIDMLSFMKWTLMFSLIPFVLLSIFGYFMNPLTLASLSSIVLFMASYLLHGELKIVRARERHEFDAGYENGKKRKIHFTKGRNASFGGRLANWLAVGMWIVIGLIAFGGFFITLPDEAHGCIATILFFQIIESVLCIFTSCIVDNKLGFAVAIMNVAIQFVSYRLSGNEYPHDYWYYGISMLCLIGTVINGFFMMYYMNYLTTRPVPNFFAREGANNKGEK